MYKDSDKILLKKYTDNINKILSLICPLFLQAFLPELTDQAWRTTSSYLVLNNEESQATDYNCGTILWDSLSMLWLIS
jgi:hypothetical protein